jgi:hypothetical protein
VASSLDAQLAESNKSNMKDSCTGRVPLTPNTEESQVLVLIASANVEALTPDVE